VHVNTTEMKILVPLADCRLINDYQAVFDMVWGAHVAPSGKLLDMCPRVFENKRAELHSSFKHRHPEVVEPWIKEIHEAKDAYHAHPSTHTAVAFCYSYARMIMLENHVAKKMCLEKIHELHCELTGDECGIAPELTKASVAAAMSESSHSHSSEHSVHSHSSESAEHGHHYHLDHHHHLSPHHRSLRSLLAVRESLKVRGLSSPKEDDDNDKGKQKGKHKKGKKAGKGAGKGDGDAKGKGKDGGDAKGEGKATGGGIAGLYNKAKEVAGKITSNPAVAGIKSKVQGAVDGIKGKVQGAVDGIKGKAQGAFDGVKNAVTGVVGNLGGMGGVADTLKGVAGNLLPGLKIFQRQEDMEAFIEMVARTETGTVPPINAIMKQLVDKCLEL